MNLATWTIILNQRAEDTLLGVALLTFQWMRHGNFKRLQLKTRTALLIEHDRERAEFAEKWGER